MGWYEWCEIEGGKLVRDTKGQGYGSTEIALRDTLIATTQHVREVAPPIVRRALRPA